jgi:UDP-N-acetylglucosamine--N-acetylmuramyl-(pentapeptide) pyrophosphoryl-undecaprenol N-acetylglucosamine transferase
MRLRVYLAPCGIGLGHITRAHPIANELKHRGIETVFSTYLDGLDYAKRNHLRTYEAVPINFRVTNDGTIDFKKTAATSGFSLGIRTFLKQVVREIQFLKQFRPDVVLSDSRASSLIAAWLLRIPTALMLNQFRVEIIRRPSGRSLTPLDRLFFLIANVGWMFVRTAIQLVWGRSQVILIPDLPSPYTISLGNLAIPRRYTEKVKLIGPIVERQYDRSTSRSNDIRPKLGLGVKLPFIYAAVSGPKVERAILARKLLASFKNMSGNYQIVLSRGNPDGKRTMHSVGRVGVYDWIENQDDFIRASDLVIGRAGHGTIMKSLAYGKPMVLVPIPDHTEQYGNARRAASLHVAEMIDQNMLDHDTLKSKVEKVLESHKYTTNASRIGKEAAAMDAVAMACDIVEGLASRS